jgi:hypothetical protein
MNPLSQQVQLRHQHFKKKRHTSAPKDIRTFPKKDNSYNDRGGNTEEGLSSREKRRLGQ